MSIKQLNTQNGFTLLEVMIAMVIFSIGLLGLAGIQANSIQSNHRAYNRTIAMQLAYNIADEMRTNTDFDGFLESSFNNVTTSLGTAPTTCVQTAGGTAPNCTSIQVANHLIYEWKNSLKTMLPSGRGTIVRSGDSYTITVMWDEERTGATGEACGDDPTVDLKCYSIDIQV